jgi:prolyl-tRNA synthetase
LADKQGKEGNSAVQRSDRLPSRDNFIEWYNSLLSLADIVDRSYPVKGTFIWMPYGLKTMKKIVSLLDKEFARYGIDEVLFPLFVTLDAAKQNDKWFSSFENEGFFIEGKELLLRPTGEPAMYPIFKSWIKKGKLPIRIYETVNSYRNESKTTHTLIRDREIGPWHEIHTVHKTREESVEEAKKHFDIYNYVWKELLNMPPLPVIKPKYELFAGADSAYEFYTILPDGKLLENGSINNLGQAYAKKFDLQYTDDKGNPEYVWQVCTGNGERFLAAVISVHGDDKGLVLPPKIAPISAVIIPIIKTGNEQLVMKDAEALAKTLSESGINVYLDDSKVTAGEKFNIWEIKGVPIRIELGEKEVKEGDYTVVRRDLNKKSKVEKAKMADTIKSLLDKEIPEALMLKSTETYNSKIVGADSMAKANSLINEGKVVKANWCEEEACFDAIVALGPGIEAIGTIAGEEREGKCIVCGKSTKKLTLIGKTY